jgi:hypothetical protein
VPNGALHRLRKTLGTIVHGRTDKTDRQLADWLGHKDPALRVRVYTGQMDDGLGKADFLDEVIPVEKWATDGQPNTRRQPQTDQRSSDENPHSDAETANSRK